MKNRAVNFAGILPAIGLLTIILNPEISLQAGRTALDQCVHTVIPTLFPYIFLTRIINSTGMFNSFSFTWLEKLCKLPAGSSSVLIMGILGGYPVGAQLVAQRYQNKLLSDFQASRMLLISNNPGPAFIFGICGIIFSSIHIPAMLWVIQILSVLMTGLLLPGYKESIKTSPGSQKVTVRTHLKETIVTMSYICGWIILFRVMINLCSSRILGSAPALLRLIITGTAELTSGCLGLINIQKPGLQFILCSAFLSAGGSCVLMQTVSVFPNAKIKLYALGKLSQSIFCILISSLLQYALFGTDEVFPIEHYIWVILVLTQIILFFILYNKFRVEKKNYMVYNQENR